MQQLHVTWIIVKSWRRDDQVLEQTLYMDLGLGHDFEPLYEIQLIKKHFIGGGFNKSNNIKRIVSRAPVIYGQA